MAAGWDLSDFGTPWPRGKLPAEAVITEMIVGFFDLERSTGEMGTADELNATMSAFCKENGLPEPELLTEDDLARVRQARGELFVKWDAVKAGEALELHFELRQVGLPAA